MCMNDMTLCDSVYVGWKCLSRHDTSLAIYLYTHTFTELSARMHCFKIFPTHAMGFTGINKTQAIGHIILIAYLPYCCWCWLMPFWRVCQGQSLA